VAFISTNYRLVILFKQKKWFILNNKERFIMKNFLQILSLTLITIFAMGIFIFPQNVGSSASMNINDIYLPFNNSGVIADVNVIPNGTGGQFAGGTFLFSSGFWLSGYTDNILWANAVASASLVEDYQAGTVGMDPNDPKASLYKVTANDIPFGQSWQDWIDAVDLGADFYDGNGDGIYNPVDLNGNFLWDPDEDKPDLLLDETYWCVFNDGVPASVRRWMAEPQGIEVRQTIFASGSSGSLGKTIFVRYRIKNTGTVTDTLKDVYFGMWADADVGDGTDDVFGCDTIRQGVYFFNNTPDAIYGTQVPAFMINLLTGPYSYIPGETYIDVNGNNIYEQGIDTPLDTAVNYLGPIGVRIYPGAKNLEASSLITYINGVPGINDPNNVTELRNYITGVDPITGQFLDPCTWPYGEVRSGIPCDEVNPYYWCSGDPLYGGYGGLGWIFTENRDVRGVGNAGPFKLVKDQEVEVLVGYEIDRSTNPLAGITAMRDVSDDVQSFYENNFGSPMVSVKDNIPEVSKFALEQNYPNPFNPSTTIRYEIPERTFVTIKVFDILGNEVATLVNEEEPAGSYEIEFSNHSGLSGIRELTSGIYFYTLSAGNYFTTKKMILLK
jgi:hypothetical protein